MKRYIFPPFVMMPGQEEWLEIVVDAPFQPYDLIIVRRNEIAVRGFMFDDVELPGYANLEKAPMVPQGKKVRIRLENRRKESTTVEMTLVGIE